MLSKNSISPGHGGSPPGALSSGHNDSLDISAISSLSGSGMPSPGDEEGLTEGHGSDSDVEPTPDPPAPQPAEAPHLPSRAAPVVAPISKVVPRSATPTATMRGEKSVTADVPHGVAVRAPTPRRQISVENRLGTPAAAVNKASGTVSGSRAPSRGRMSFGGSVAVSAPKALVVGSVSRPVGRSAAGDWRGKTGPVLGVHAAPSITPTLEADRGPWAGSLRSGSPLPREEGGEDLHSRTSSRASSVTRSRPGGATPTAGSGAPTMVVAVAGVRRPVSASRVRGSAAPTEVPRSSSTLKGGRVVNSAYDIASVALEKSDDHYLKAKCNFEKYIVLKREGKMNDIALENEILKTIKGLYELSGAFMSMASKVKGIIPDGESVTEENNTELAAYLKESLSDNPPSSRPSSAVRQRPSSASYRR